MSTNQPFDKSSAPQGMFQAPFSFEGRIRRTEYGLTLIITSLTSNFLALLLGGLDLIFLFFLLLIPITWFGLAQGAKRCHDRGVSGWWQLIPFYGLWLLFGDGEPRTNEYGPDPKGRG